MIKKLKRKFLIIFILILFASKRVNSVPLPGAYGFTNPKPPQSRNYGIESRAATAISTNLR